MIREALRRTNKLGLGRVVMHNREYGIAMKPHDRGFLLTTLRSSDEVRSPAAYFEGIQDGEIDEGLLQHAQPLIDNLTAAFDESAFEDRSQQQLLEIIKAKLYGSEPVIVQEEQVGKVQSLMEAFKLSAEQVSKKSEPARPVPGRRKRVSEREREGARRREHRGSVECRVPAIGSEAEPLGQCVPRQSLGTRRVAASRNARTVLLRPGDVTF